MPIILTAHYNLLTESLTAAHLSFGLNKIYTADCCQSQAFTVVSIFLPCLFASYAY